MQEADRECEFQKSILCVLLLQLVEIITECSIMLIYIEHVSYVEDRQTDAFVYLGKNQAKQEDLKEMGDISSGMSSSIMQIYLKQVLESFFHSQSTVRHFALSVITLTLNQGLIHPVQVCSKSQSSIH